MKAYCHLVGMHVARMLNARSLDAFWMRFVAVSILMHTSYTPCVGLGLGVWEVSKEQGKLMVDLYADILKNNHLPHICDVEFSWFPEGAPRLPSTHYLPDAVVGPLQHIGCRRNPDILTPQTAPRWATSPMA